MSKKHKQVEQKKQHEQPLRQVNDQPPERELPSQQQQQPQGQPLKQVNNPVQEPKH